MAISNYRELQQAVADWISRSDDDEILTRVPDFIRLGEARLFRELRIAENSSIAVTDRLAIDGDEWALPVGYRQARRFYINGLPLTRLTDVQFFSKPAKVGMPTSFIRYGDTLKVWPVPDADYRWMLSYWRSFELSTTETSNAVLSVAPDAYLFGALVAAEPFLENDQRISLWESQFANAIEMLNDAASTEEISGSASISSAAY
ncbi:phage adaptor protein [Microbulbifer sp. 2201CG32-9]|uniref:phage adaptor protein n=1 Tax=Microbulbifer sp. 2201CG32-9 TaxID=3232309 RepID=UPI00345C3380